MKLSEKSLPLITINKNSFEYFFQNSMNDLINRNNLSKVTEMTFKEFENVFCNFNNELPKEDVLIITHFCKLLDNIYCLNDNIHYKGVSYRDTEYFSYIKPKIIDNLVNKPIIYTLVLLPLLTKKNVRDSYINICTMNNFKVNEKILDKSLVLNVNSNIYSKYYDFIKGQFTMANEIFKGIFELAKNIVEHSENKEGQMTIRIIAEKKLTKKNQANKKLLWDNYFTYIKTEEGKNAKMEFSDKKNRTYLEVSITDTGTVGIIETSLRNMQSQFFRKIPEDIINYDVEKIKEGIKLCAGDRNKEAKLLFDMYFGNNKCVLNRQANNAFKGLGICLFTKFINDNYGIINVQTNKYCSRNETINFSYSKCSDISPAFINPEAFGTKYNIILPLFKKSAITNNRINRKEKDVILAKGVYEKMLPLIRYEQFINNSYYLGELEYYNLSKYVIKDDIKKQDKLLVISLNKNTENSFVFKIDRSMLFRTINLLFVNNKLLDGIIIKDLTEDLITGLYDIYKILSSSYEDTENKNDIFFPENKILLLLTKTDNRKKKGAIIAGNSVRDCLNINHCISLNNDYFEPIHQMCSRCNDKGVISKIISSLNNNTLFYAGQLIALDFFEKGASFFEKEAQNKLEKLLDDQKGYRWENTHLKIGSKLHLDDFIYGKKMFQQSKEVSSFAFSLSRHIYKNIRNSAIDKKKIVYTLVGYGYYSELLVSRTSDFIKKLIEYQKNELELEVKYIIVKDDDEIKFSRYLHDLELRDKLLNNQFVEKKITKKEYEQQLTEERLILIVPISSTLTTCLKIENAFYTMLSNKLKNAEIPCAEIEFRSKRFKMQQPFYTIVVVGDQVSVNELKDHFSNNSQLNKKDIKFNIIDKYWISVKNKQIVTRNRESKKERRNKFFIYIKSKWQQPQNCKHCFPDNPLHERPLFVTDKVSVTPSLIFESPKWYNTEDKDICKPYFRFAQDNSETNYPIIENIDWAHYKADSDKHFNYYLNYPDFIELNESKLKLWAENIKLEFDAKEKVLLIAPDKSENGKFIHLINREIFDDKANIIRFDKSSDHFLNFHKFFEQDIENATKIYFIDNLMLSGKTFLSVDGLFKILYNKKRINAIFCLINRMDFSCYNTIKDCLKRNNSSQSLKINMINSFVNLYLPESDIIPCEMCDEEDRYKNLIKNTSLDCIKEYFAKKELLNYKEVTKENLTENILPFNFIKKRSDSVLWKTMLIHFINQAFANCKHCYNITNALSIKVLPFGDDFKDNSPNNHFLNYNAFINDLYEYIKKHNQCHIDLSNNTDLKLKSNVIKVLSSQYFKRYRGVYISVFYWVLTDLIIATITILKKFAPQYELAGKYGNISTQTNFQAINNPEENWSGYIAIINYLRLLIKYASVLNISYLFHQDFITAINELINANDKLDIPEGCHHEIYAFDNLKLFCAAHIISSLQRNMQKSIKFEKVINTILSKERKSEHDTSFLELLILENTNIIKQTLDAFRPGIRDIQKILDKTSTYTQDCFNNKVNKTLNSIKEKLNDYELFMQSSINNDPYKIFGDTYTLREILLKTQLKDGIEEKINFKSEAQGLIKTISSIIGYTLNNENNCGGGLLLYKYQNLKYNDDNNYIVIANIGDEKLSNQYANLPMANCLATEILNGKVYLEEQLNEKKSLFYTWTNYSVYHHKGKWVGQDNSDCSLYPDIMAVDDKIKRIVFIRISNFDDNNVMIGDAVFILYDNNYPNNDFYSIHKIRFIHSLRKEINDYFKDRYRNDSFRVWVEETKSQNAPDHNYYNILSLLREYRNDEEKYLFLHTLLMVKKDIHYILTNKKIKSEDLDVLNLKERIEFYCNNIFDNKIQPDIVSCSACEVHFSEPLFRHIMFEYLYNIKKQYDVSDVLIEITNNDKKKGFNILIKNKCTYMSSMSNLLRRKKVLQERGYCDSSKIKGLYLNYLLLEATRCSHPSIEISLDKNEEFVEFRVCFTLIEYKNE